MSPLSAAWPITFFAAGVLSGHVRRWSGEFLASMKERG